MTRSPGQGDSQPSADRLEDAFALYQDDLLGMLYHLLGNIEDARDAFQEVFLKCWRNRQTAAEVENLKAWIFRVAINAGRDMRKTAWRRRRQSLGHEATTVAASDPRPDREAAGREQIEQLRQAIHRLRPEEQEVFLLRQNGTMTYEQIAETLGTPTGTVKTRMRLALAKLREALETQDH